MTIEEKYQELVQLKDELIAQREHAVENKSNVTRPTKHYRHVKRVWLYLDIIVSLAWVYFTIDYFSTHNVSDVLNFHDIIFNVLTPIWFWYYTYDELDNSLTHYSIEGGDFVSYNYRHKEKFRVSISEIRYIELVKISKNRIKKAGFGYDKYEYFNLETSDNQELLSDLLRVNPDIEIRREL